MVYGDNKPYNVALVAANMDAVKKWASDNGVSASGDALLEDPKVKALFKKELDHYGEKFKGFEEIRDHALISEDFTTENGMLTPSLKVKRKKVLDKYLPVIEALYTKKREKSGGEKGEKAGDKDKSASAAS
jgi:long-chain acyl-CoA synthetase